MVEIVAIVVMGLIAVIAGVMLKNNTNFKATYRSITDRAHTGSARWQKFILSFITPAKWETCSAEHDIAYTLGINRFATDLEYLRCMLKSHICLAPIALLYFLAVRMIGWMYFKPIK